jgi:hypothetical protein
VSEVGVKDWVTLAMRLPGRLGKQCRERWRNHLDPDVNREAWTEQEDQLLIDWHEKIGSKWVKIAEYLPGRSDNAIKNRWNSTLSKRIEYEQNGLARPKRGRPSQKALAERAAEHAKPKSADDVPKPPRLDCIAAELKAIETPNQFSAQLLTPQLLSPLTMLRSPFWSSSFTAMRDLAGFNLASPTDSKMFGSVVDSPGLFWQTRASLKENREDFANLLSPEILPK